MLTDPETQKLQAALEQLESERQRRIDERIEKGEVVRVLPVVVGLPDGIEAAKAAEVGKLQAAGETREVHFGQPMLDADGREIDRLAAIITGVPRVGRDRIPDSYLFSKPPAPLHPAGTGNEARVAGAGCAPCGERAASCACDD